MWHGLPARENTAKMAVPPGNSNWLNTYERIESGRNIGYTVQLPAAVTRSVLVPAGRLIAY